MSEREALVALYHATDGPNWTDNTNWLSDAPMAEWYGVTTGDGGRVTGLSFTNNQLTGPIPPELGGLTNLEELSLTVNQLTGTVPPELGSIVNLEELSFADNRLTGAIPPELGRLSPLRLLHFHHNQLTGAILRELGDLTNLKNFTLSGNQLTGEIPPELGNRFNLEYMAVGGNRLTGCIPDAWRYVSDADLADLGIPFCDPAPAMSPSPDRAALVAFYNATDGPNW